MQHGDGIALQPKTDAVPLATLRCGVHAAQEKAPAGRGSVRRKGYALARVRVLPEIKPFFHGLGFAIIGPQCLISHWPGNCGLVVAGSATAGAGHDLRGLGVGCEDADYSASTTGGAYGRRGLLGA